MSGHERTSSKINQAQFFRNLNVNEKSYLAKPFLLFLRMHGCVVEKIQCFSFPFKIESQDILIIKES